MLERPLLILVGLTGTGKTTTVNALRTAGLTFSLLPNRRMLTDNLIIKHIQEVDNKPVETIIDRTERFAYTRRYRELYPGGMAWALKWLMVNGQWSIVDEDNSPYLIFDGLRGENEVTHAVKLLPQARFLFLDAPDAVRVRRLLRRGDTFDRVENGRNGVETAVFHDLAKGILTNEELQSFLDAIATNEISAADLQAKLAIVRSERENYDLDTTHSALQALAPERLIFADTSTLSPAQIAQKTIAALTI